MELPFLVVHGAMFWKVALGALCVIVLGALALVRWRRARSARAVAPRWSLLFVLCVAGATAFGGWKIEQQLGEHWRDACRNPYERFAEPPVEPRAPLAFTNADACVLAAAMPGSRTTALERIRDATINQPYRDAGSLDRAVEIAMFVDGCSGALPLVMAADRYDARLALARRCGDRRSERLALMSLGQFEEAAAIDAPAQDPAKVEDHAQSDGATLILAGRWLAAANAADARAKQIRARPASSDERRAVTLTALSYDCLAEYLRHAGGDAGAEPRLRLLAAAMDGTVCAPELAELASTDERRVLLEARPPDTLTSTDWMLHAMAWLEGFQKDSWGLDDAEPILSNPDDISSFLRASIVWLVATTPPLPAGASGPQQIDRLRWAAVKAVFDGNVEAAAVAANAAVTAAATLPDPTLHYIMRDLRHLPALVGLRTAATSLPVDLASNDNTVRKLWLFSFGRLLLRTGGSIEGAYFGPVEEYVAALAQAEGGDGSALVHQIGSSDHQWWSDADVMAVLPRITRERDVVVRQLTWSTPYHASNTLDRSFPWSIALHAIARRDVLTLAGQPAEAARWNEIYRRFDIALRDRQKLIALMLWQIY